MIKHELDIHVNNSENKSFSIVSSLQKLLAHLNRINIEIIRNEYILHIIDQIKVSRVPL